MTHFYWALFLGYRHPLEWIRPGLAINQVFWAWPLHFEVWADGHLDHFTDQPRKWRQSQRRVGNLVDNLQPLLVRVPIRDPGLPCQRFRHGSDQCRTSMPNCAFCSEFHRTKECPNKLAPVRCANCEDALMSSFRLCGIYLYEYEVMKLWSFAFGITLVS